MRVYWGLIEGSLRGYWGVVEKLLGEYKGVYCTPAPLRGSRAVVRSRFIGELCGGCWCFIGGLLEVYHTPAPRRGSRGVRDLLMVYWGRMGFVFRVYWGFIGGLLGVCWGVIEVVSYPRAASRISLRCSIAAAGVSSAYRKTITSLDATGWSVSMWVTSAGSSEERSSAPANEKFVNQEHYSTKRTCQPRTLVNQELVNQEQRLYRNGTTSRQASLRMCKMETCKRGDATVD